MASDKEQIDIIIGQLDTGSLSFVLAPARWADCQLPVQLKWYPIHFDEANKTLLPPDTGGIYGFVLEPQVPGPPETAYLLYIGKTREVIRRYGEYLFYKSPRGYKYRPHIHNMLNKWPDEIWFFFAKLNDRDLRTTVESTLLNSCIPPFNIEFKGRVNTAVRQWRNLGGFR